jgi:predicted lipid carrier protein YhbT
MSTIQIKGEHVLFNQMKAKLVHKGPLFLRLPLKMTPFIVKKRVIEQLMGWQFRQALADGELDFLEGRTLKIEVRDLALSWSISLIQGRLVVNNSEDAEVTFSGDTNDLILIAARKEDPDTLFFQRRLIIEGDTELGLFVKNLMDSIDLDTMPAPLRIALMQLASFVESGLNEDAGGDDRVSMHANQN